MHTCLCIVLCYYCCHVENVDAWFLLVVLLLKYVLLDSWIILWMCCIFNDDDDDDDDTLQQLYSLLFRLLELGWVLSLNQLTSVSFAGIKYNLAFDWYYVRLFLGSWLVAALLIWFLVAAFLLLLMWSSDLIYHKLQHTRYYQPKLHIFNILSFCLLYQ